MPATITRLHIAGFKSFAEPATIDILPGLTGIVGPNGCGKSNVVEALRWAMGETSARNLRGGEMDEVIFAGSAARPARSIAEVVVTLDDATGLAPGPLAHEPELQVSRSIERASGSTYRVNGREMRARDVQTIFADIASGARSSAMVSQGRVAFLVDARPEDRRSVLEEAAGITGLHARRQEAELRLRAAEANLARVADARAELKARHAALAAQAEAAHAYRLASESCQAAEQALLAILLGRAALARSNTQRAASAAMAELSAAEQAARDALETERHAEAALAGASDDAALAAALMERARAASAAADADNRRASEALEALQVRIEENLRDHASAGREAEAAVTAHLALINEAEALESDLGGFAARHAAASKEREAANLTVTREAEQAESRRRADAKELTARSAADDAIRRAAAADDALASARSAEPAPADIARARDRIASAAAAFDAASEALASCEGQRRATEIALAAWSRESVALDEAASRAEERLRNVRQRHDRLVIEHDAAVSRRNVAAAAIVGQAECARVAEAAADARRAVAAADETLIATGRHRADTAAVSEATSARALVASGNARDAAAALKQAKAERDRLVDQRANLLAEQSRLDYERVPAADFAAAHKTTGVYVTALETARERAAAAEQDREALLAVIAAARAELASLDAARAAAAAELDALSDTVADDTEEALLTFLVVSEALEPAIVASLGDALAASLNPTTAYHWRELGPLAAETPLPLAAKPLCTMVEAPGALSRILSHVGLIDDATVGLALQSSLQPGQALVTTDGSLFRWDGLVVRGGRVRREVERLRVRRRMADCRVAIGATDERSSEPARALSEASSRLEVATTALAEARASILRHDAALADARNIVLSLTIRDADCGARAGAIAAERERVDAALTEALEREAAAQTRAADADDVGPATNARSARLYAEAAAAAENDARSALRASEAALTSADALERQLAARNEEAFALLAALDPALARLRGELSDAETEQTESTINRDRVEGARADHESQSSAVAAEHEAMQRLEAAHRQSRAATATDLDQARLSHADLVHLSQGTATRIAVLESEAERAHVADVTAQACLTAAIAARAGLGPISSALEEALAVQYEAQQRVADLKARATRDRARLATLAGALPEAARRRAAAAERAAELQARLADTRRAYAGLLDQAPAIAGLDRRASLALTSAEAGHRAASEHLRDRQAAFTLERDRRRQTDLRLSTAREAAQRAELLASQATTAADEIAVRASEIARDIAPAENPTAAAEAQGRRRLAAALKTRDESGPVNLVAEREATEAGERLAALAREAGELEQAVARLRGTIGHLNREGREKLSVSFAQIDQQFRSLFSRMFDGGRANLALVGSDDPLQAGLEIYAQPPGKKLATLSLLSGGEQALTALSLIFAVFCCSPSPVCVLDEVDAPLDDANVERFCRLVADMGRETGTRFLVVTHHQLTMANMDRLYGVTMQERGVSRLLSVDLGSAEKLGK